MVTLLLCHDTLIIYATAIHYYASIDDDNAMPRHSCRHIAVRHATAHVTAATCLATYAFTLYIFLRRVVWSYCHATTRQLRRRRLLVITSLHGHQLPRPPEATHWRCQPQ